MQISNSHVTESRVKVMFKVVVVGTDLTLNVLIKAASVAKGALRDLQPPHLAHVHGASEH